MTFRVVIPVNGYVEYIVDADNADDAKEKAALGEGEFFYPYEYNEDADSNNWEVY